MSAARNPYAVLGVPADADTETIKRAFRARAREHHPDRSRAPGAEARFRELVDAYRLLAGPVRRRREPHPDLSAIVAFYAWLAARQAPPAVDEGVRPEREPVVRAPRPQREHGVRAAALAVLLYAAVLLVLVLTR